MKLVPGSVLDFQSSAEERVFSLLKQVNLGPNDVALHSLNLGKHAYKRWGEADFLIVSTKGLFLIEVKGGRVACRNGVWEYTNRFGKITKKRESPASQAASAFFSLEKNYLRPRFRHELDGYPMGWGVLFEGIDRVVNPGNSALPELPDEITGYRVDCSGHNSLRSYLARLEAHWASNQRKGARTIPNHLVSDVVSFLRPNFEQVPPLNSQLNDFDAELCSLTQEQCDRLDELQENDRMMLAGGAGSGKTFLAMASARYDAAEGRQVVFATRSPFLAEMLKSHQVPENVTICSMDEIPELMETREPFDTLILDEGQDMCQMETLDLLDRVVVGGLEKGRWRWFGDHNNQVSSAYAFDPDALNFLQGLSFRRRLSENIRNAPPIVETLHAIAPVDVGKPRTRGVGSEVKVHKVQAEEDIPQRVGTILTGWISDKNEVNRSDIAVLCPDESRCESILKNLNSRGIRAERLSKRMLAGNRRNCVVVATIDEFKGLERQVVCVAGLAADQDKRLFSLRAYLSFSRANYTLAFVCLPGEASTMVELEKAQLRESNAKGVSNAG
ncbi:nuclease-related domain-containing DEAD/DEAH box helicase [Ruegeria arenilitoris]|uniref:nuclease-related domain-containing DEAD/DEAH box helicase n=1 Tax=Ruegeria arenilitoris TaxID=1173585 RepID=UPI0014802DEB|nr:NERD domain-containing protein [Ruegeria arenilitoris]